MRASGDELEFIIARLAEIKRLLNTDEYFRGQGRSLP